MPFKVPPGGFIVSALPTALAWPCKTTEADPPTRTGSAAYLTSYRAMPAISLGSTASPVPSVQWTTAPILGPNNEAHTRVRCYVLATNTVPYQLYFGWDGSGTGTDAWLGFGLDFSNPALLRARIGQGAGAQTPSKLVNSVGGPGINRWWYCTLILDRAALTLTLTLDGNTITAPISAAVANGSTANSLNFTGVNGYVSSVQVDYYA